MLNCKILETSASNIKLNNRSACISFWNIWTNKRHIISLYHCTIFRSVEQSLTSSQKMPTTSTLMLFCTLRSTALASSCYGCFWNDRVVLAENELIVVPAGFGCSSIMWSTRNSIFCIHKNSNPLFFMLSYRGSSLASLKMMPAYTLSRGCICDTITSRVFIMT